MAIRGTTIGAIRRKLINVPGQGRDLGPPTDNAPTPHMALGTRLVRTVHRGQRPTTTEGGLTTQPRERRDTRTTVEHPDSKVRQSSLPPRAPISHTINHATASKAIGRSGLSAMASQALLDIRRSVNPRRKGGALSERSLEERIQATEDRSSIVYVLCMYAVSID